MTSSQIFPNQYPHSGADLFVMPFFKLEIQESHYEETQRRIESITGWERIFDYYRTTGDSYDGKLLYVQCYSSLIFNFAELEYWKFTPSFKFRSGDNGEFSRRSYYSS